MSDQLRYRELFYKQYYQSQVGRLQGMDSKSKLLTEKAQFTTEILPYLPADKTLKILDIGCGFGSFIAALKDAGYSNVKGVDISEEQVLIAHESGIPEVEQHDISQFLGNQVEMYDIITGLDIIEHFSKDELLALLQLIRKALKKDGLVVFRTPNMDAPFASIYAYGDFTHEVFLNSSSARQVMINAGFNNTRVLASSLEVGGILKSIFQKLSWLVIRSFCKWVLMSTARTSQQVIFTPNLIIISGK